MNRFAAWTKSRVHIWQVLLGAFFALLGSVGFWTDSSDGLSYLARPGIFLASLVALWVACLAVIVLLTQLVDWLTRREPSGALGWNPLVYGVLFLVCWTPYLVGCFPGTPAGDLFGELPMYFGLMPMTSHHPPLVIALYGAIFSVGSAVGGSNGGIFALVVSQALSQALSFAAIVWFVDWAAQRRWLTIASALFFGLLPLFPVYAQFVTKDVYSSAALGVFAVQLLARARYRSQGGERTPLALSLPALVAMGVLANLLRNNNVFVTVPGMLAYAVTTHEASCRKPLHMGARSQIVTAACACAAVTLAFTNVVYPALGIEKGKIAEAFSLPVQQTARYQREYPDDATQAEREVLSVSFVDSDSLGALYDESLSDPVKDRFLCSTTDELMAYGEVWLSQGVRHPDAYAASAIEGSIGYWYPFGARAQTDDFYADAAVIGSVMNNSELWGELGLEPPSVAFPNVRAALHDFVWELSQLPPFSLLFHAATYGWAELFLCVYLLRRHGRGERGESFRASAWVLLVMMLLQVLTCCASPVSADVRYALPLWYWLPLAAALPLMRPHGAKHAAAHLA